MDRRVGLGALDAVQQQVHGTQPGRQVGDLPTGERSGPQVRGLVGLQVREALKDRLVGAQEEATGAARRVADAVIGAGQHHVHNRRDQRPRREVLARAAGALLRRLLDQPLVGVALQVGVEAQPLVAVPRTP